MSLVPQKHHNCPTCRCTIPIDEVSASVFNGGLSAELPEELFDGWSVSRKIEDTTGKKMNPEDVSNVLDAVVALARERLGR